MSIWADQKIKTLEGAVKALQEKVSQLEAAVAQMDKNKNTLHIPEKKIPKL